VKAVERLFDEWYRFEFSQAISLLERNQPSAAPLGEQSDPSREAVSLRSTMGLSFDPSPVMALERGSGPSPASMLVSFMGLAGADGPLPFAFTELLAERDRAGDGAMRDFLDLFNHRLLSILYRTQRATRVRLQFEPVLQRRNSKQLAAIAGLASPGMLDRLGIRPEAGLFYSGILAHQPAPVSGVEAVLSDYFNIRVVAHPLRGRWIPLSGDQMTRLGSRSGQNARLGSSATLGNRFWDQAAAVGLTIGPCPSELFAALLPGRRGHRELAGLARLQLGDEVGLNITLTIRRKEAPRAMLGQVRLGWTSWLPGGEPTDVVQISIDVPDAVQ
jgi:type VI secretion system protein ImpH